jgi:leucyl-tRNA synthetase
VDVDAPESEVERRALADERVKPWLATRRVARVVVIPNRLVNIVTRA